MNHHTREPMDPIEHAAHLRQTATLMEEAAHAVERVEHLEMHAANLAASRDHLRDTLHRCQDGGKELQRDKAYAEEQLTNLAKFIGLHGMTWAHVVSEAVSMIERLRTENVRLTGTVGELKADLDRLKRMAHDQQGAIAGHQRSVLRAQSDAVIAERREAEAIEALEAVKRENETLARQVPPQLTEGNTVEQQLDRQTSVITDLRDLLTSAHAIAARGGEDTNWEAFIGQLKERGISSITAKVFRKPVDYTVKSLGTDGGRVENPEPIMLTYEPAAFTKILGQAWCRVGNSISSSMVVMRSESHHATLILCNVHRDVTTGAVTYVPISFEDLPRVTEAAAP